jgi:hypothetical protein
MLRQRQPSDVFFVQYAECCADAALFEIKAPGNLSVGRTQRDGRLTPVCSRRRTRVRSAGAAETWYVSRTRFEEAMSWTELIG